MSDLVLEGLELEIERLLKGRSTPARHCANNSIRHLKRAWRLKDSDSEMTALRAIAAEEEAASAVFHSLRARRKVYPLATELDPFNHVQKFAFTALVDAVESFFGKLSLPEHYLTVEPLDGEDRLRLRVKAPDPRDPHGPEVWVLPLPPLHGLISRNGKPEDFATEIRENLDARGFDDVSKQAKDQASRRKQLLYANHMGIPEVTGDLSGFLDRQRQRVFRGLGIFLMIDPYEIRQDLVDQSLQPFLKMINRLAADIVIGDSASPCNENAATASVVIDLGPSSSGTPPASPIPS